MTSEEGKRFADENAAFFFEMSAKDGANVESGFLELSCCIMKRIEEGCYDLSRDWSGIKKGVGGRIRDNPQKKNKCRC